jgi:hypothetical protein
MAMVVLKPQRATLEIHSTGLKKIGWNNRRMTLYNFIIPLKSFQNFQIYPKAHVDMQSGQEPKGPSLVHFDQGKWAKLLGTWVPVFRKLPLGTRPAHRHLTTHYSVTLPRPLQSILPWQQMLSWGLKLIYKIHFVQITFFKLNFLK